MDPIKNAISNLVSLIQENLQKIPLAVRQWIYSIGALVAAVYSLYVAANGDWNVFWKSLIATAIAVIARGNATGGSGGGGDVDGSEPDLEDIDGDSFDEAALATIDSSTDVDQPHPGDPVELATGVDRYGNTVSVE